MKEKNGRSRQIRCWKLNMSNGELLEYPQYRAPSSFDEPSALYPPTISGLQMFLMTIWHFLKKIDYAIYLNFTRQTIRKSMFIFKVILDLILEQFFENRDFESKGRWF